MKSRVLILGAGFAGLELATMLSEAFGDDVDVTLIDKSDAFVFGYSKLDVMFGRTTLDAVRLPYRDIAKPGVRFLQETITAIDPEARRVTTDCRCPRRRLPGRRARRRLRLRRHARTRRGRQRVLFGGRRRAGGRVAADVLAGSSRSSASVERRSSVRRRRASARCCCTTICRREACATPARSRSSSRSGTPIPPSPDTSRALVAAFAERDIEFVPNRRVTLPRPGTPCRRARRRQRVAL